ncbi:hypothetical protein BS640_18660 [Rouxiella badensis]|uniref:Uncharacterized protein n=1 Tax=Rouxiella badensis TaxID=1646377 RepID=A0A1X0WAU8_9GAMM|nr:hypothetical protein BS640_18660 [Rouxiella badensis]
MTTETTPPHQFERLAELLTRMHSSMTLMQISIDAVDAHLSISNELSKQLEMIMEQCVECEQIACEVLK